VRKPPIARRQSRCERHWYCQGGKRGPGYRTASAEARCRRAEALCPGVQTQNRTPSRRKKLLTRSWRNHPGVMHAITLPQPAGSPCRLTFPMTRL